ncbi:CRISPR-associated helicase Cas3' [Streptomyces sp. NPDC054784]
MSANEAVCDPCCPVDPRLWGKERGLERPYPVVCHLLDTAAVCLELWDCVLGPRLQDRVADALGLTVAEARSVVALWAGLHDVGKISPVFQAQVPSAFAAVREDPEYVFAPGAEAERAFRHEVATHWSVAVLLEEAGYPGGRRVARRASHQVAQLLGGHHGLFGRVLKVRELAGGSLVQPGLGEEGWVAQRRAHFVAVRDVLGADAVPKEQLPSELAVVVAGLVVVSDWLASQTDAIRAVQPPSGWKGGPGEVKVHWARARGAAHGLVEDAQLGRARFAVEDFASMFNFSPNPLQRDLVDHLPSLVGVEGSGLLLVTAPTGDGKTEAALFAASVLGRASGARGLYFALPTMATADGMFPRVDLFARKAVDGERALALLHSMAWLHPAYSDSQMVVESSGDVVSADAQTSVIAGEWLRGRNRGLLASMGLGTVDQALSAVLPVKHNALRLFGLSDKVFVVDEAHAYGPWMHSLLVRLLEWLGAFRAPVVLLSATLTGRAAGSLVDAYRRGAGFVEPVGVAPRYPGWLFVDAGTGGVSEPRGVESARERRLDVSVRRVVWDVTTGAAETAAGGGRREALRDELAVVAREGGTALVCCTTVEEAQRTFRDLRAAFPRLAKVKGGLRLLHSRYPARDRQRITKECTEAYGKPGPGSGVRPASILVATQVVEQSLDFDFDLVVSDLAPLAQLLQRAGRARRHARGPGGRPGWARDENAPRLVVWEPVDEEERTRPPGSWRSVYDRSLLVRTAILLREVEGRGIAVPGDLQALVDEVYAEDFVDRLSEAAAGELKRWDAEREGAEMAEAHLARSMAAICGPGDVGGDLYRLSERHAGVTEELVTTRLGADSGRVLCVYEQSGGALTLDQNGDTPLNAFEGKLSREQLRQVVSRVAPVPGGWLRGAEGLPAPRGWDGQPLLRGVVLLRMTRDGESRWVGRHGDRSISITPEGLESI